MSSFVSCSYSPKCQLNAGSVPHAKPSRQRLSRSQFLALRESLYLKKELDFLCKSSSAERVADEEYMKEYSTLKSGLLDMTRKSGAVVAGYLLLTTNGQTALCSIIGMAFSNVYLLWMFRDVDSVKPTDRVPMFEAKEVQSPITRYLAMLVASYYHALRPRLLVPISLAALMAWYNSTAEVPLSGYQEVGLLLGFLSYKGALYSKVAAEAFPKATPEETSRPRIEKIEEEEALKLDRWGRPLKPKFIMPTEALPEDVDTQNPGLLPSLLVRATELGEEPPDIGRT
ncbi:hypothetical protein CEUSTIGMA_g2471.t1 [Chlamydomonas eustigma]|uniref:Uncharacterized protein n=1 Tax=Chlamydomonas eustigma TaxID=1157962 RepID=A0A250WW56_9CHLO|nr:hypothetical protein CEUSTIGMA_g2471.t1 [Chlamydomonas eustigma]|eukprot:GAX75025.1 hypothetical protein CEUSTIGMA_g2471.t1 [Chlamydomonas eustigma]